MNRLPMLKEPNKGTTQAITKRHGNRKPHQYQGSGSIASNRLRSRAEYRLNDLEIQYHTNVIPAHDPARVSSMGANV